MSEQRTYWGILCRTCGDLVAFDTGPFVSFVCGTASRKPGAIRCDQGHTHIYFPGDFRYYPSVAPIADKTMEENRAVYRAINLPALTV
jgi:hypothetical protein